jgi:diguanylate cyclase (GGDEF)-like protein
MTNPPAHQPAGWRGERFSGAPRALQVILITVELAAAALCAAAVAAEHASSESWIRLAILAVLCSVFEEVALQAGKLRLTIGTGPQPDMTSVWTFAGVMVLPAGYASLFAICITIGIWVRRQRAAGQFLFRKVYSSATIVLACLAASSVLSQVGDYTVVLTGGIRTSALLVGAIAAYTLTNRTLVVAVVRLAGGRRKISIIGSWRDNSLELSTLCLGMMTAFVILSHPLLSAVVFLPMVALQRGALIHELEELAATDAKTGLLNSGAWRRAALGELSRAQREGQPLGVLLLDLDHFKAVNDRHGHLVGDAALTAVGRHLTREFRQYDLVGRFGGEEFVAILPRLQLADALLIADRVRASIASITLAELTPLHLEPVSGHQRLSASIGVAVFPTHGSDLDALIGAADAALYQAKAAGRNRVAVADEIIPPAPTALSG